MNVKLSCFPFLRYDSLSALGGEFAYIAESLVTFPLRLNAFKSLTGESLLASLDTYSCCLTGLVLPPV